MANDEAIREGRIDLAPMVDVASIAARFHGGLYRFAVSLTKSEPEAADLAQQTLLILIRRAHQIRDFSQIKCWLFTTLRREFLRTVRCGRKHSEVEFLPDIHDLGTRDPEPWRSLDGRIALDALSRVDEPYRAPLKLFYLSELSYKEIAETLEIPPGTVMSRLSRGKEQLKSILADGANLTIAKPKRIGTSFVKELSN